MLKDKIVLFLVTSLFFLSLSVVFVTAHNCTGTIGEACECSNCSDCNDAINIAGQEAIIQLNTDISVNGTCIEVPGNLSNKTFDCLSHAIEGNYSGIGINVSDINYSTIKNCVIKYFEIGINMISSKYNTLDNNSAYNDTSYGMYLEYSDNNTITRNTWYNNGDGADIMGYFNTLSNNKAYLNANGIYLYTAYNTTSYDDEVYDNSYGFVIDSCENTTVYRIEAYRSDYGVYISNSYNATILDSLLRDNTGGYGIYSTNSYSDLVKDSTFRNNTNGFYSNSQSGQIINNTFENNSYAILGFADSGNIFENNTLTDNNESGFYIQRTNTGTIKGNTVTGSQYPINLVESTTSTCTGTAQACNTFTTQPSCNAQQGCFWNVIMRNCGGIVTPCAFLVRVACTSQAGCSWITDYYNSEYLNISNNKLLTGLTGIYVAGQSLGRRIITHGGYHNIIDNNISGFGIGLYLYDVNHNDINGTIFSGNTQDFLVYDPNFMSDNKVRNNSFGGVLADFDYLGTFNISKSAMEGNAPSGYANIGRFLRIANDGNGGNVSLTVYYSDSDLGSIQDESTLGLWHYSGAVWQQLTSTLNTTLNSVFSQLTSFSNFGIFGKGYPIPVSGGGGGRSYRSYPSYPTAEVSALSALELAISPGQQVNFKFRGQQHSVKLSKITRNTLSLVFTSNPVYVDINAGQKKQMDITGDNTVDIEVEAKNVTSSKAVILLKEIVKTLPQAQAQVPLSSPEAEDKINEAAHFPEEKPETEPAEQFKESKPAQMYTLLTRGKKASPVVAIIILAALLTIAAYLLFGHRTKRYFK